jgi:acyl-CoA reductase-like NAD-dependent aldehyde dehydrogenase
MTPFDAEVSRCRAAQAAWARRPVADRVRPAHALRVLLVEHADELTAAVEADVGRRPGEVVATDLLPSAAACRFLERRAARVLRPRKVGDRPLWLLGCRDVVYRRPHGVVGVIGTWNYPVFLNVVAITHALAAGNGVLWKPSEVAPRTAGVLSELFHRAGVPSDLLVRLTAAREAGPRLAEADVDFVHFTGSEAVGRKLAARLGERLVPSVLELSGVDAMLVLGDADARLAARAAWYGATLNAGQTCVAVRRAFVHRSLIEEFVAELKPLVEAASPVRLALESQAARARHLLAEARAAGAAVVVPAAKSAAASAYPDCVPPALVLSETANHAIFREASFAPLLAVAPFNTVEQAVALHNACAFGLSASVFTADAAGAETIAARLHTGSVVVNDAIAPTAHPATPFGGRGASGWGATQGEEGLLAMTVPQVVTRRRGTFRPHIDAAVTGDRAADDVTRGLLRLSHARGLRERWRGLKQVVRGMRNTGKPPG